MKYRRIGLMYGGPAGSPVAAEAAMEMQKTEQALIMLDKRLLNTIQERGANMKK